MHLIDWLLIYVPLLGLLFVAIYTTSIPALVQIGPLSETCRHGSTDPAKWVEIYSPDKDCSVRNLSIDGVTTASPPDLWVKISEQKPNPDYPHTTPRGGNGKGRLIG